MGKSVVLHYSPVLLLVAFDDGKVVVCQHGWPMDRSSRSLIESAFALDDIWWHKEANPPVGTTALLGVFGIVLLVHNMIVENRAFSLLAWVMSVFS